MATVAVLVLKRWTNISSQNQYHILKTRAEVQVQGDISGLPYFHEQASMQTPGCSMQTALQQSCLWGAENPHPSLVSVTERYGCSENHIGSEHVELASSPLAVYVLPGFYARAQLFWVNNRSRLQICILNNFFSVQTRPNLLHDPQSADKTAEISCGNFKKTITTNSSEGQIKMWWKFH